MFCILLEMIKIVIIVGLFVKDAKRQTTYSSYIFVITSCRVHSLNVKSVTKVR